MKCCQEEIFSRDDNEAGGEEREKSNPGMDLTPCVPQIHPRHPGSFMFDNGVPHLCWIKDGRVPVKSERSMNGIWKN
jgi:hypothetical protein